MSKGELSSFLNRGTFMAKLPIVKEDSSPHVVPLWFVLDAEDNIIFGTATNSVKGKNISCDPRVQKLLGQQDYRLIILHLQLVPNR